jgi:hypothetical protein
LYSLIAVGTSKAIGATKQRQTESTLSTDGERTRLDQPTIQMCRNERRTFVLLLAVGKSKGVGEAEERRAKSGVAGEAGGAVARLGAADAANVSSSECVYPKQSEQSERAILNSEE